MKGKGLFIIGTDTGAGKTVVTGALGLALRAREYDVGVMKPVETGCTPSGNTLIPEDGAFLKKLINPPEGLEDITPLRFLPPVAPSVASREEGGEIDLISLAGRCERVINSHEITVIEGIGGLLVPLSEGAFLHDLIKLLDLPVLVVAPDRVGVINHSLLTVRMGMYEGLRIAGLILNETDREGDISRETNLDELRRHLTVPVLGRFPFVEDLSHGNLLQEAERNIDIGILEGLIA